MFCKEAQKEVGQTIFVVVQHREPPIQIHETKSERLSASLTSAHERSPLAFLSLRRHRLSRLIPLLGTPPFGGGHHLSTCAFGTGLRLSAMVVAARVVLVCAVLVSSGTLNEMLEQAEDEATSGMGQVFSREQIESRVAAAVGHAGSASAALRDSDDWAAVMTGVTFAVGGVDDEILPYIAVGAAEAELKEAPGSKGMAVLHRKNRYAGLRVQVLQNQLVVLSGAESPVESRARQEAGLGPENALASELAGTPINGTAMFMIA